MCSVGIWLYPAPSGLIRIDAASSGLFWLNPMAAKAEEKYSYCDTNNSGRNTRLTSISEVRDEDDVGTSKQMKDSSTDTGEDNMENKHLLLDVSNSVSTTVPPDLSPR